MSTVTDIDVRDFSRRLLQAISDVQSSWISGRTSNDVFEDLLGRILDLTDSEYGYIGEVMSDGKGKPYLLARALTDIPWDEDSRALVAQAREEGGFAFRNHDTLYGAVLTTGRPVIANDAPNDPRSGGTAPGHLPLDRYLGLPLWSEGELVGSVGVSNRPGGYDEELVAELEPLTRTCATIVRAFRERRRLVESHAKLEELAQTLRESLLPPSVPTVKGIDVAARFRPATHGDGVLGDFYDIFPAGTGRWAFVMGDVQGHGAPAAKTTALARWTLQSRAAFVHDPGLLLEHLNERLLARDEADDRHMSAVAIVAEVVDRGANVFPYWSSDALVLRFATAGHQPPLIRRVDGTVDFVEPMGTVLGVVADAKLKTRTVRLHPGDALVIFTDGVTESHHRDIERGEGELQSALAAPLASADEIADVCMCVAGGGLEQETPNPDDSAVMVIRLPLETPKAGNA